MPDKQKPSLVNSMSTYFLSAGTTPFAMAGMTETHTSYPFMVQKWET